MAKPTFEGLLAEANRAWRQAGFASVDIERTSLMAKAQGADIAVHDWLRQLPGCVVRVTRPSRKWSAVGRVVTIQTYYRRPDGMIIRPACVTLHDEDRKDDYQVIIEVGGKIQILKPLSE